MRYSQLRAFHHVASEGGFSAAAAAIHQSQPSLSDQVRRLEQAHDTLLFDRSGRQVRLTQAGEGLLRLTRQFFEQQALIEEYLNQSRAEVVGTLRIVADNALHITDAIHRFRQAYPDVFVTIRTGNTEDVMRHLRDYDAEVGVVANQQATAELDVVDLGQSPIIAIAAQGLLPQKTKSLRFGDLPKWPLIFREEGSRTRADLLAEAERLRVKLKPVVEVEGREALREIVASGAGLGFVSEAESGNDDRIARLPLTGTKLGMRETLVSLSARREVPVIRAFLRIMSDGGPLSLNQRK